MIALIPQIFAFGKTFSEGKSNQRNQRNPIISDFFFFSNPYFNITFAALTCSV